jgi:membrane protein DedA with SNARE-associated domain
MGDLFGNLGQWTMELVYSFGYLGVAVLIALSNLCLPIPSQVVLPLAGFLVDEERFSFSLVLLFATVGSLVGSLILYAAGRLIGEERLRWFFERFGRFMFVGEKDLDKANGWFKRHGDTAVLVARVLPGAGSLISMPAGIERMPLWLFVIYTAIGNVIYNATLVGLGWALGSQWTLVEQYVPIIEYVALAALAGGILWFLVRRWKAHD